ncbi:hypothetical protein [Saccharopolyspora hirsuta]|uniref:hypothetical protein n=1 Tax=Saccharopolyspora hirsuta TaxID=1837 RepID=UPI00332F363D
MRGAGVGGHWWPQHGIVLLRLRISQFLAMLAIVLSGLGCWFAVQPRGTGNEALVDAARTAAVRDQVGAALEAAFSYRHDDPEPTRRAVAEAFGGPAVAEYERLFAPVREQEQLALRSRVAASGVRSLEGSRAHVVVFLDQLATRGDTGESSSGGAQLSVTAEEIGGRWRITGVRAR